MSLGWMLHPHDVIVPSVAERINSVFQRNPLVQLMNHVHFPFCRPSKSENSAEGVSPLVHPFIVEVGVTGIVKASMPSLAAAQVLWTQMLFHMNLITIAKECKTPRPAGLGVCLRCSFHPPGRMFSRFSWMKALTQGCSQAYARPFSVEPDFCHQCLGRGRNGYGKGWECSRVSESRVHHR